MTGETDDAVVRCEVSAVQRRDEQTRTVLFILRFAYWLQILRKHTSFFMVNIVVTIIRNFNHRLNRRSRELTIHVV